MNDCGARSAGLYLLMIEIAHHSAFVVKSKTYIIKNP